LVYYTTTTVWQDWVQWVPPYKKKSKKRPSTSLEKEAGSSTKRIKLLDTNQVQVVKKHAMLVPRFSACSRSKKRSATLANLIRELPVMKTHKKQLSAAPPRVVNEKAISDV